MLEFVFIIQNFELQFSPIFLYDKVFNKLICDKSALNCNSGLFVISLQNINQTIVTKNGKNYPKLRNSESHNLLTSGKQVL